ncbi:hypothetical protein [Flavobacterium flavigenum]|uniref:hypothetical protein n=1 Tax=Flavobacterium flavigenum TaxID=3003258 RepID=UPI0022ABEEC1|nr:hypothetical protein [Flavobacterium flavigenum]
MKNIYILALFLLFLGQTKAQNIIPIEKHIDYIGGGKGIITNTYFKDVNHLMDPLIGTWQGSIDNKTYTFYVTKTTRQGRTNSFDELEVRHYIVDNSTGTIIEDSRNGGKLYIAANCFRKEDSSNYELNYWGANSRCGQKGWIRLKSLSPTTMNFYYSWNPLDLRRREECPGGVRVKSLFPENVDLILTKLDDSFTKSELLKCLALTPKSSSLYQYDGFDNSEVTYPTNVNDKITTLLDVFISTDDTNFRANKACAAYKSEYKVKTESTRLLSMEKIVSASSCNTPFVADSDYFNFFETDNGVVYSVNIKKNSYIVSEIGKFAAQNTSCNYLSSTTKAYLFFEANKPKLFIKNQSCNGTINLDSNQLEFVFTDTSVNLIKTNTYIVD